MTSSLTMLMLNRVAAVINPDDAPPLHTTMQDTQSPPPPPPTFTHPRTNILLRPLAGDKPDDTDMPYIVQRMQQLFDWTHTPQGSAVKRRVITFAVLAGITKLAYNYYQSQQRKQHKSAATTPDKSTKPKSVRSSVAVNRLFFSRLMKILHIVVPSPTSLEARYITILTILLVSRTMFSIYIAELVGINAQSLVGRKWKKLGRGISLFALITIPAACINSGLKYYQDMISLRFRVRLSQYVHSQYLDGVNFYKASNLGGNDRIENADQRVTSDIKDFSDEIAKLYSSLLKPLLDVVLFTYKLGTIVGWQGPALMHCYFMFAAYMKKNVMPNLGKLVARESELEGFYRTAHTRVITNSEEIAFFVGSVKEKSIINRLLNDIYVHISYHRYVKALIGVFDQLLVKYYASIAGYIALCGPLVFNVRGASNLTTAEMTRDYIRNSQYLGNLSTAVADLVVVGNKLVSIAGYTSRVSELLEQVKLLNSSGNKPFALKADVDGTSVKATKESLPIVEGLDEWMKVWKKRCSEQAATRRELRADQVSAKVVGGGTYKHGEYLQFEHVDIVSPEGKLLVRQLDFKVEPGVNCMVTGPNGVGKSSLFRVIGNLWPLHNGVLTKPHNADVLFVPQKPYLVLGTLRDQIIYPHSVADMERLGVTDDDLRHLLAIVDPAQIILGEWTFDTVKDWFHAFSGGQKQRCALARLFYHRPMFAILDECTSAVSDEVEDIIYSSCRKLGITIFTVSHRPNLARHHELILKFTGRDGGWAVKKVTDAEKYDAQKALDAIKKSAGASSPNRTASTENIPNDAFKHAAGSNGTHPKHSVVGSNQTPTYSQLADLSVDTAAATAASGNQISPSKVKDMAAAFESTAQNSSAPTSSAQPTGTSPTNKVDELRGTWESHANPGVNKGR